MKVHGDTTGLKSNQRHRLTRLYSRKVRKSEIISAPLAQTLSELSAEIGRQIGITLDRSGRVRHVIVGDAKHLFIPDLGRARAGRGRFRGIRLVHTHLGNEPLDPEDFTDLVRLRFDLVAAVGVSPEGRPATLYHSHLLPAGSEQPYATPVEGTVHASTVDFTTLIEELEAEFTRSTVGALETDGQTRAIAVHVTAGGGNGAPEPKVSLRELAELADTAGVIIVENVVQRRKRFDPRFLIGRGKLNELLLLTMQLDADLVIFDQDLTPNQVHGIAAATDVKVIDRSQLILDIFARRAHTREGKLQVELAQLKYTLPRLAHRTTAYSRLMGGIGGRGPGETKLEVDRRRARERILRLERQLVQVGRQRQTRRQRRANRGVPVVSIVGYTNAGKSTLFNAITRGDALTEDKLFATLDPMSRRLRFPQDRELVISDTVGFIRDLPPDLVTAFKATLEELQDADLLLHVVDISDPRMEDQIASVEHILDELELARQPRLRVFNKTDRLSPEVAANICELHGAIGISALDRVTTRGLMERVESRLWSADRASRAVLHGERAAPRQR